MSQCVTSIIIVSSNGVLAHCQPWHLTCQLKVLGLLISCPLFLLPLLRGYFFLIASLGCSCVLLVTVGSFCCSVPFCSSGDSAVLSFPNIPPAVAIWRHFSGFSSVFLNSPLFSIRAFFLTIAFLIKELLVFKAMCKRQISLQYNVRN